MLKEKTIKRLIYVAAISLLASLGWAGDKKLAQEQAVVKKAQSETEKKSAKETEEKGAQVVEGKAKLLCKSSFEDEIQGFSVSNDGSYIVVWSYKIIREDPVTFERKTISKVFLLNKEGKKIWEYCIDKAIRSANVSPKGNFVLANFSTGETGEESENHIIDCKTGKLISKFFTDGEIPKISPHEKYILVDNPVIGEPLKVFDKKGILLWDSDIERRGYLGIAEFITDEEIILFDGKKIILYTAKNGQKLWEKDLERRIDPDTSHITVSNEVIALSTGDELDPSIYLINKKDGQIIHRYSYGKFYKWGCRVSLALLEKGKYLIALIPPFKDEPGYLLFFDNQTGRLIWNKRVMYNEGEQIYVLPNDKQFFIKGSIYKKKELESQQIKFEPEPYNAYIFDKDGNILWRSDIDGIPKFLDTGEFLIIQRDKKAISLFNATNLIKDLKLKQEGFKK